MEVVNMSIFPQAISSDVNSKSTEIDLPFYRKFGRTDLTVSCLGLGGGGGISSEDTLYAFDQGMNYFFYSTDLHHSTYSSMSNGLQQLCKRGSSVRDKVVLATVTYIKSPEAIVAILFDQFKELGIDYIDVFFWGWVGRNDKQSINDCLQLSPSLRGCNSDYQKIVEEMFGASELMKKMGIVRYIGASFHDINLAKECLHSPLLDVVMVRSNVTHRYAQSQIFNQLNPDDPQRPGIVNFKSTSCSSGLLWDAPVNLPAGCWIPKAPDLYRYCLSQNSMDVCLTGLQNRAQIDAAIAGVKKGKLTPAEINYLNLYGDLYNNPWKIIGVSQENLIYRD
ncbi:MAG: aldo/keto reductase [Scytonematopsis contorta HA4267-MV1]|jgi:aryl-alcohol dehydrogenase-like predicted oxidoreductase|nr:aldo/keto reductase [Scytonematopsis contorta HA4267-MV1]